MPKQYKDMPGYGSMKSRAKRAANKQVAAARKTGEAAARKAARPKPMATFKPAGTSALNALKNTTRRKR